MASTFTLDLARFGKKTEEQMSQIVRKICLDLFTIIVTRSPVDTGRFRANNQIDLNGMSGSTLLEFHERGRGDTSLTVTSTTAMQGRESAKLAQYKLGDTVFLYNNVVYAMRLEFGHSKQAPSGVYRVSVHEIISKWGV